MSDTESTAVDTIQLNIENPIGPNKPSDSRFKQQKLPSWQPLVTARSVVPIFAIMGIIFIPTGIALIIVSNNIKEIKIEYTNCKNVLNTTETCAEYLLKFKPTDLPVCKCTVEFNITEEIPADVYMYYGLTNFYQNHRIYVSSKSDIQLFGNLHQKNVNCEPFRVGFNNLTDKNEEYAPCGAIANSFFQDRFVLQTQFLNKSWNNAVLNGKNIVWTTDKERKFKNPVGKNLKEAFNHTIKPRRWLKPVYELDTTDPDNNGFENEDLIAWMKIATLPTFRKLYRKVEVGQEPFSNNKMHVGNYKLNIDYSFEVTSFGGKKFIIFSTTSLLGGKNPFYGIVYVVTGTLSVILAIIFYVVHLKLDIRNANTTVF